MADLWSEIEAAAFDWNGTIVDDTARAWRATAPCRNDAASDSSASGSFGRIRVAARSIDGEIRLGVGWTTSMAPSANGALAFPLSQRASTMAQRRCALERAGAYAVVDRLKELADLLDV